MSFHLPCGCTGHPLDDERPKWCEAHQPSEEELRNTIRNRYMAKEVVKYSWMPAWPAVGGREWSSDTSRDSGLEPSI